VRKLCYPVGANRRTAVSFGQFGYMGFRALNLIALEEFDLKSLQSTATAASIETSENTSKCDRPCSAIAARTASQKQFLMRMKSNYQTNMRAPCDVTMLRLAFSMTAFGFVRIRARVV
jgi:hypothetical protein